MLNFIWSKFYPKNADLYEAVAAGNESRALEILNNPHICPTLEEMRAQQNYAASILSIAIKHPPIFTKLLEVYADEFTPQEIKDAYKKAIKAGFIEGVAILLSDYEKIYDLNKEKAFIFSIKHHAKNIFELVLPYKKSIGNAALGRGFRYAVKGGDNEMINRLLTEFDCGCIPSVNRHKSILTMIATKNLAGLNILFSKRIFTNIIHKNFNEALILAKELAADTIDDQEKECYQQIVERLLQIPTRENLTKAVAEDDVATIHSLFLENNDDISRSTMLNALLSAIEFNHPQAVRAILEHYKIYMGKSDKRAAIEKAVTCGHIDVLNILLSNDPKINLYCPGNILHDIAHNIIREKMESETNGDTYRVIFDRLMQTREVRVLEDRRLFIEAAKNNDVAVLNNMLNSDDIDTSTVRNALLSAIEFNHPQAVRVILEHCEYMDNGAKRAAIETAVTCGHIDVLNILLSNDEEINFYCPPYILHDIARKKMESETNGNTYRVIFDRLMQIPEVMAIENRRIFIEAAKNNEIAVLNKMLNSGDIDSNTMRKALSNSVKSNHISVIDFLLSQCEDQMHAHDKEQVVCSAVKSGYLDTLNNLLSRESFAAEAAGSKNDALNYAKKILAKNGSSLMTLRIIDRLMQIPAIAKLENRHQFLHAASLGDVKAIEKLLTEYGNDIDDTTKGKALVLATKKLLYGYDKASMAAINALLFHCVNNISDTYIGKAIYVTVSAGNAKIMNVLLENGSVAAQAAYNDNAALKKAKSCAIESEQKKITYHPIIDRLMQIPGVARIENCRLFIKASKKGHVETMQTLLNECGNDIDDHTKGKALNLAAQKGHAAVINALLLHCVDDISNIDKGKAVVNAVRSANIDALNALLANESIAAQATYDNNAALLEAQDLANGDEEDALIYQPMIDRLLEIPVVAEFNPETNLAAMANRAENSMRKLSSSEKALVQHLAAYYAKELANEDWDNTRFEMLEYFAQEYQKCPAKDGYSRVCMTEKNSPGLYTFPADTIMLHPVGEKCRVYLGRADNYKTCALSDIQKIYHSLKLKKMLHTECQDRRLLNEIMTLCAIPAHPNQDKPLPLAFNENNSESAQLAYYRHPVHSAWRYLSDFNPWMSKSANFVSRSENGGVAVIANNDKELIQLFWKALNNSKVTLEKGFTQQGNLAIFANVIAEINRGHNCDERPINPHDSQAWEAGEDDIATTTKDNLGPDTPSCSFGVTTRLLQSAFGHPHINDPKARPLSPEIMHNRIAEHLIKHKVQAEDVHDNLLDKLDKQNVNVLKHIQQEISDLLDLGDDDNADKIMLSAEEAEQRETALSFLEAQIIAFQEGTDLWFSEERMAQVYTPLLELNKNSHESYHDLIDHCVNKENVVASFCEILWNYLPTRIHASESHLQKRSRPEQVEQDPEDKPAKKKSLG